MAETQFTNIIDNITKYQNAKITIKPELSEDNVMSILFTRSFVPTPDLSSYFLSDKHMFPIQNYRKYYDINYNIVAVDTITASDKNIVDLDISPMQSQQVIKYLFLLDLLSEMYYAYNAIKGPAQGILSLKCRYYIEEGIWKLYNRDKFYTVDMLISTSEGKYDIVDIKPALQNNRQMLKDMKAMCDIFFEDIKKHILYFAKKDVQQGLNNEYLYNIQTFYKFCRVKLIYYTLRCIDTPAVKTYVDSQLIYVFLNLKNYITMKNPGYQNIFTTNKLLTTKKKLQDINQKTLETTELLRRNDMQSKKIKDIQNKQMLYLCSILLIIFTVATFLLLNIDFPINIKNKLTMVIILVTIAVYTTIHYILHIMNIEKEYFASSNLDNIFKFPRYPATAATYNYNQGDVLQTKISIFASTIFTQSTSHFKAFDGDPTTSWECMDNAYSSLPDSTYYNVKNSYIKDYYGEVLQINLNEDVILKYIVIKFLNIFRAPADFRIYASPRVTENSVLALSDSSWVPLLEVKSAKYYGVTQKRFNISESIFDRYQYPQSIAAGRLFSIVRRNQSEVYGFGLNSSGQLGMNMLLKKFIPEQVVGSLTYEDFDTSRGQLKNVVQVAAGGYHTLFLTSKGMPYACGNNQWGQLGDGSTISKSRPVNVLTAENTAVTDIIQVSAGHIHSLFLKLNKTAIACGRNSNGQLGTNDTNDKLIPVPVLTSQGNPLTGIIQANPLTGIIQVCSGVYGFASYFLKSNGTVYKCGIFSDPDNISSSADKLQSTSVASIISISDLTVKIASGGGFCLALTDENIVWGIGQNKYNQLCKATFSQANQNDVFTSTPVYSSLTNIVDIAAGTKHSLFLKSDGTVLSCGANNFGQLGIGTTQPSTTPMQVKENRASQNLSNIVQISAGDNHSIFLKNNSNVLTCGFNGDGQLGMGRIQPVISDIAECQVCMKEENMSKYIRYFCSNIPFGSSVFKADPNLSDQTRTFLNNHENIIYKNNINKPYKQYALAVNRIVGNYNKSTTPDNVFRVQVSDLELWGVYNDQANYLKNTIYNQLYAANVAPRLQYNSNLMQQQIATRIALQQAIDRETIAYNNWSNMALQVENLDTTGMVIPDNMPAEYFLRNLPDISAKMTQLNNVESNIINVGLYNAAKKLVLDGSNTDLLRVTANKSDMETRNSLLRDDIDKLNAYAMSFESYKKNIEDLKGVLSIKIAENNGVLSEADADLIQGKLDEDNAAARLGRAQLDNTFKSGRLRLAESLRDDAANDLADIRLRADQYGTKLQNEIDSRRSILSNIAQYDQLKAEAEQKELDRLAAERDLAAQRTITESAEALATIQTDIADRRRSFADELSVTLNLKIADSRTLQNNVENMLRELKDLDRQIDSIEADTNAYVDAIERRTVALGIRRERKKKWLEYQIELSNAEHTAVIQDVQNKIREYQTNIDDDNAYIQDLMKEIEAKRDEIVNVFVEKQRYKYVPLSVSVDSSVTTIQTKLLFNINNTATAIANSIILTGMDKEYKELEDQKDTIKVYETKSGNDVELNLRDDKIIFATNKLLLNVLLVSVISIIIYSQNISALFVIIFTLLCFSVIIAFYYMEVLNIVRTYGSKYYWDQPSTTKDLK